MDNELLKQLIEVMKDVVTKLDNIGVMLLLLFLSQLFGCGR
jgi:hypothetical protein